MRWIDSKNLKDAHLEDLKGKTIKEVTGLEKHSEEVRIFTECGKEYLFYHCQDCCEDVSLEDFEGDPKDLKGALIVSAEEVEGEEPESDHMEYYTWTFYKIETNKGGIWMRWLGESNGYYGEEVDFVEVTPNSFKGTQK